MNQFVSGYSSPKSDWSGFLKCWRSKVNERLRSFPKEGLRELPAEVNIIEASDDSEIRKALEATEQGLGVRLPKSFKDFQIATKGHGWYVMADGYDRVDHVGRKSLYGIRDIGPLQQVDPTSYGIWEDAGTAKIRRPSDREYLRYGHGSNQVDTGFDGAKLNSMIKVGGLAQGTLVLLNQHEVTLDGEMEAWVLAHWHGLVRYKSFAELVREMAYRDIHDRGGYLVEPARIASTPCLSLIQID